MTEPREHTSADRWLRISVVALAVGGSILTLFFLRSQQEIERCRAELAHSRSQQLSLMNDYHAVLEDNHRLLTQGLVERYFDFLIEQRNKMESGYAPSTDEEKRILDRAAFIVENMSVLELPADEAKLRLQFIVEVKRSLAQKVNKTQDVPSGNH